MTKLFLHIGLHKTGSTLIQNFCAANRQLLRERGLVYPQAASRLNGHHNLAWSFNIGNPNYSPELGSSEEIVREALAETKPGQDLLLSSEDFEFVPPPRLKLVLDSASVTDVIIIVYLRRQDAYLESEYAQHVRMDETRFSGSVQDFYMKYDFMQRYDYNRLLRPWEQAFGRESLIVRPFERGQFHGGDLLKDFCAQLGMNWSDAFAVPAAGEANVSLSPDVLAVVRELNKLDMEAEHRQQVLHILAHYSRQQSCSLLSEDLSCSFRQIFQQSNALVAERYLGRTDEPLFNHP
ncbi:MAG: hypothetical protein O3B72_06310 [Proteobacteria bacterium]|nr:hypothetical protein [Pseudomonadota bacterium]